MNAMQEKRAGMGPAAVRLAAGWSPGSWREHPAAQQPMYPDATALRHTLDELHALPPDTVREI